MRKETTDRGATRISKTWRAQISAWQRSGLSGKEFCRRQQLSYDAFTYWRRKVEAVVTTQGLNLVPVPAVGVLAASSKPQERPGVKIDLGDRLKIEVYDGFSPATLTRVITTLRGC